MVWYYFASDMGETYCDCISVCPSVCWLVYLGNTNPSFTKLSVCVACGLLVNLVMYRTSRFVDDTLFKKMRHIAQSRLQRTSTAMRLTTRLVINFQRIRQLAPRCSSLSSYAKAANWIRVLCRIAFDPVLCYLCRPLLATAGAMLFISIT